MAAVRTVISRSTIHFLWLLQILDGGWNELFKGMLYFYSWHSIPHSIREKMVGAGRVRSGWDQIKTVCAICSVLK